MVNGTQITIFSAYGPNKQVDMSNLAKSILIVCPISKRLSKINRTNLARAPKHLDVRVSATPLKLFLAGMFQIRQQ